MVSFMRNRTAAILPVTPAIAISLWPGSLAPQGLEVFRSHAAASEPYPAPITPAIHLINFLFLYMANPHVAANTPAYRAPIPQAVVDCLEQNPTGCPYADFKRFFEEEAVDSADNQSGK